jgi:glycine hydroxymethyltransferase
MKLMKDTAIYSLALKERKRQQEGIELIPSENYASRHVRNLLSSVFVNKYSEGYPKARYYGGNEYVDDVELIAQKRAQKLFGVPFVNVQPYSGSPANLAVLMATCNPGDPIIGQSLTAGGHLTHGHMVSASGIYYKSEQYGVREEPGGKLNDLFDYAEIRKLAKSHKPKVMWVGTSAYPLQLHYDMFAKIADEVGALLVADMAHIAGLVAGGAHPSPVPHVHIITTTTHKTLRGPRGAMIMVTEKGLAKDPELPKKINKAVFPGLQGGPHDNQTAAIAVALHEASQKPFKTYARNIVSNADALASALVSGGLKIVGNRTETHLILIDLTETHGPGSGIFAEKALDLVHLTLNKNTVPGEKSSPFFPSGIRLGTPAATTRGMMKKEMKFIANVMLQVLDLIRPYSLPLKKSERLPYINNFEKEMEARKEIKKLRREVTQLSNRFPIP